jgi:ParB-like chromosome segregation protein Spo0J
VAERVPVERLKPAPWNPRTIRDPRFENLCRSIEADPEFLERRPILAQADGTVYGGNMRLRAVQHLGWSDVPAVLDDIPDQLAKERALKDNRGWGDDLDDDLGALLASLGDTGTDLSLLGFEDGELERLLAQADGRVVDPDHVTDEWRGMPEFEQQSEESFDSIKVHFRNEQDREAFLVMMGEDPARAKSIWYPKMEYQKQEA